MNKTARGDLISITEAARMLGVSGETVRRWIHLGLIPAKKVGAYWKIDPKELPDEIVLEWRGGVRA